MLSISPYPASFWSALFNAGWLAGTPQATRYRYCATYAAFSPVSSPQAPPWMASCTRYDSAADWSFR